MKVEYLTEDMLAQAAQCMAEEALLRALDGLSYVNNDKAKCHAIMALQALLPESPMPPGLVEYLNKNGFYPDARVATEAEIIEGLSQSTCTCDRCNAMRAKHGIAIPMSGTTVVH